MNYDDPICASAERCQGKVIFFSHQISLDEGVFIKNDWVVSRLRGTEQEICLVKDLKIPGLHNLENAMAAVGAGLALGLTKEQLHETLTTFPGVEHRLEPVRELNGVLYVNDSKATNPEAAMKALEAFDQPIILIMGGSSKGSDFSQLEMIKEKVKHLIVLGQTADDIIRM